MSERKSENTTGTRKAVQNSFLHYVKGNSAPEYIGLFFFSLSRGEKLVIPEISHNRMTGLPLEGLNVSLKTTTTTTHGNSEHGQQSQHQKDNRSVHRNTKWN